MGDKMADITEGNRGLLDSLKKTIEKCKENGSTTSSAEITAGSTEEIDLDSDTNDSYAEKKNKLIQLMNERKKLEEEGKRSSAEYKEKGEEAKSIQEEIKDEMHKEIESCEKSIQDLSNGSKNAMIEQIIAANQDEIDILNNLLNSRFGSIGDDIVERARGAIGVPYVWGGEDYTSGMDCSGLVRVCYGQMGIDVPHQTGSIFNSDLFEHVDSIEQLQPGDLIQFGGPNSEGHIGIYTGEGTVIHEPTSGMSCTEVPLETFCGWTSNSGPYYLHYKG